MSINLILSVLLNDTFKIFWLGLALFVAGVLEALLWKTPLLQFCDRPIQVQWFGENKKWRGLITLPFTHLLSVLLFRYLETDIFGFPVYWEALTSLNILVYGLLGGFIFNLSELPNSFIKRRLNIASGDESHPLFYWIDHMDSTYGILLFAYFCCGFSLHLVVTGLILSPFLFMGATWFRRKLGLKV